MKTVNWDSIAKPVLAGKRGKYNSGREMLQKAHERDQTVVDGRRQYAAIEPALKKSLFDHLVARKPIQVVRPIVTLMEVFKKSGAGGFFTEQQVSIPAGTELVFKSLDQTLGKLIFDASNGQEYEIYSAPQITLSGQSGPVPNAAWYGLLQNTSIYHDVMSKEL